VTGRREKALVLTLLAASLLSPCPARADADPWLARDKYEHFAVSTLLSSGAYGVAGFLDARESTRLWAGGVISMGAGTAKELWDLAGHGDPSWRDLAWDGVGTATGLLTAWWVERWWRAGSARSGAVDARAR
jgi:putative lipoprotein